MTDTFEHFVEKERTRLTKLKEEAFGRRRSVDQELAAIDKEMKAVNAYDAVKSGKPATSSRAAKTNGSSASRAPRNSRQQDILDLLRKHKDGISRGEIIQAL